MALPVDIEDRATANGFLSFGVSFLRAAKLLTDHRREGLHFDDDVVLHVIGLSIENALKAALRHSGVSASDLAKKSLGHGLCGLLAAATASNWQFPIGQSQSIAFAALAEIYGQQPFRTRYPYSGSVQSIDANELLTLAVNICNQVEDRLNPERVKQVGYRTSRFE